MRTELCDRFGIDYPIFVFTPCLCRRRTSWSPRPING